MTAIQICALIALTISTALLYWIGYRNGFDDGCKHQPTSSTRRKAA
ncbi:hypothetical protein [Pseudomonas helleri]|nr:hypothetical protein [Pseudomonas helleri]